jgi:SAM-dependent methyltransferase
MTIRFHRTFRYALALPALLCAPLVFAQPQPAPKPYEPTPFQAGKDVIWLATPQEVVNKMLDLGQVTAKDFVIDLGSGDGRTVITAARRGARGMGIEYNPDLVEYSNRTAKAAGVSDKVKFIKADLFETDFNEATLVTMYLLSSLNLKLRPKILDLKPGTRVVSHAFDMADWKPDRTETIEGKTAYLWLVPAKVAGVWQLTQGELTLTQSYQFVEGALKTADGTQAIRNGQLRGDQLSFSAGGADYTGRVSGNRVEGTVKGSASGPWSASRASDPASNAQK